MTALNKSYVSAPYRDTTTLTYAYGKVNGIIIDDIDRNGFVDIVTFPSNFTENTPISPVAWMNTNGIFTASSTAVTNYAPVQYFRDSIMGDFNSDGFIDYVQVDQGWELNNRDPNFFFGSVPQLLLGSPDGLKGVKTEDWLSSNASSKKTFNHIGDAADFDGDGDLDIAIATFSEFRLYVNDGNGRFSWDQSAVPLNYENSGTTFIKLGNEYKLIIGNYRNAREPDLQVLNYSGGKFSVTDELARPNLNGIESDYGAVDMYDIDVNNDGLDDLIVTWETESTHSGLAKTIVSVYLQDEHGRLNQSLKDITYNLHLNTAGAQLHFQDFNNDGYVDFYGSTYSASLNNLDGSIWINNKNGTFVKPEPFTLNLSEDLPIWYSLSPFFFDANNDGVIDVVGTRGLFDKTSHYRNVGEEVRVLLGQGPVETIKHATGVLNESTVKVSLANGVVDVYSNIGLQHFAGVNRLHFNDLSLAVDIEGNAGTAAKILGALWGKESVENPAFVGIVLHYLDSGVSYEALLDLALGAILGANKTNEAIVELGYTNLIGVAPTDAETKELANYMNSGAYSQAGFARAVADLEINAVNIDLVGLSNTGIAYQEYFAG